MNTEIKPFAYPNCTCEREYVHPNANLETPAFTGIVRFGHWKITNVHTDCPAHAYLFNVTLAADLRYGD